MQARSPVRNDILPMQTAGTQHLIERTYRESGQYQWVRELLRNAFEAGATHVEFGIEWQAVESDQVYRRMIADNGCGMTADQLKEFFNTFGGGGKPIGGAHENFGVGSKTSLLPWNKYGMVVISWVNGDPSMIWVKHDERSGEYGLKLELCESPTGDQVLEEVYSPYSDFDLHGCDWSLMKPDWVEDHGTVIILLGNSPIDNTVEGDPNREEKEIKGISAYLNRRFWEIPENAEVFVDELRTSDHANWPPNEGIAHGSVPKIVGRDRRTNFRRIRGAQFYVTYPVPKHTLGRLGSSGTVNLKDGTAIDWYLWEGTRPFVSAYAAESGYVGVLYDNELYDVTKHHSTYRSFGVSDGTVRTNLWLIIRPPVDVDGKRGVYPRTDRNSLLIKGGPNAGGALPLNDWAGEFADNMPSELVEALKVARKGTGGSLSDEQWRERLAERFGSRWKIPRMRLQESGKLKTQPDGNGEQTLRKSKRTSSPGAERKVASDTKMPRHTNASSSGSLIYGKQSNGENAELTQIDGGLPAYEAVGAEDVPEGILAVWQPHHPQHSEGAVLINTDHPVLRHVIEHWQSQYADHHAESIEQDVIAVYGEIAVSKIAHSEHLRGILPSNIIDKQLRSDESLTMGLLGLMAEDHLISTRVGGKYSKKRNSVIDRTKKVPR